MIKRIGGLSGSGKILLIISIIFLALFRFIFLDQDSKSFFIDGVAQEDEAYYTIGAINEVLEEKGMKLPVDPSLESEALVMQSKPLTYLGLKVFGNTFWGLRIPVVLVSLLCIYLFWIICCRFVSTEMALCVIGLLVIFFDFTFFQLSRFHTPLIYAVAGVLLITYYMISRSLDSNRHFFILGVLGVIAVGILYVYSAFMLMAIGIVVLERAIRLRKLSFIVYALLGGVSGIAIVAGAMYIVGDSFSNVLEVLLAHGGGVEKVDGNGAGTFIGIIKGMVGTVVTIITSNFFRFNMPFLFVFLLVLPLAVRSAWREKDKINVILLLILACFYCQSIFVHSYPFKKNVMIYPIILLLTIYNLRSLPAFLEQQRLRITGKIVIGAAIVAGLGLCLYSFKVANSPIFWSGFNYTGDVELSPEYFKYINLGLLLCFVLYSLYLLFSGKRWTYLILSLLILPGAVLILDYDILNRSYLTKEGLKGLNAHVDSRLVLEGPSHYLFFYANAMPGLNPYYESFAPGTYRSERERIASEWQEFLILEKVLPQDSLYSKKIGEQYIDKSNRAYILKACANLQYYKYCVFENTNSK